MIFCLLPNEAFRIEVLSSDWLTVSSEKVLHDFAVRWARVMMDGPCKGEREVDDVTKEVNEVFRFAFMKNEEPVSAGLVGTRELSGVQPRRSLAPPATICPAREETVPVDQEKYERIHMSYGGSVAVMVYRAVEQRPLLSALVEK